MKHLFLVRLFYAIAETIAGAGSTPVALTSPKLDELNAQYSKLWSEMIKHTDPKAKETKDAKLAVWKIEGEIKAEEARLLKDANDAKIAEQRNVRLKLNQNQLESYLKMITLQGDKKAKAEDVQAAVDSFNSAKELVDNELLAKYAASKPSKPKTEGDTTESTATSSANKEAILELARAGKTQKEIIEAGYKRSTVWHTVNNAKIAGETFVNA